MPMVRIHMYETMGDRSVVSFKYDDDLNQGTIEIAGMGGAKLLVGLSEPHGCYLPDQGGPFGYDDKPHPEVYAWVVAVCAQKLIGSTFGFERMEIEGAPVDKLWASPAPAPKEDQLVY